MTPWLLPFSLSTAIAMTPPVVEQVKRGTVFLRVRGGEGSGFFIRDDLVVTNEHVVGPPGSRVQVVIDSGTREGITVWGTVLAENDESDLALVRIKPHPGRNLRLSSDTRTIETLPVVAAGFPNGSDRALGSIRVDPPVSLRTGAVTALFRHHGESLTYVEHNANMQKGSSGGPLVDQEGKVVGVNVAMLKADETTKLAIPVGILSNWMTQLSIPVPSPNNAPVAQEPGPTAPTTSFSSLFEAGLVRDFVAGTNGHAYALSTDGRLYKWDQGQRWAQISDDTSITSITIDAQTNALYVTSSANASIWTHESDRGWRNIKQGTYLSVAANGGRLYAVHQSGAIHTMQGEAWIDLGITGAREVDVCGTSIFVRTAHTWAVYKTTGVPQKRRLQRSKDFSCVGRQGVALYTDGSVVEYPEGRQLTKGSLNDRVFATPEGNLLLSRSNSTYALWWLANGASNWARVPSQ